MWSRSRHLGIETISRLIKVSVFDLPLGLMHIPKNMPIVTIACITVSCQKCWKQVMFSLLIECIEILVATSCEKLDLYCNILKNRY